MKWSRFWGYAFIGVCLWIGVSAGMEGNTLAAVLAINLLLLLRENISLESDVDTAHAIAEKALALADSVMKQPHQIAGDPK